MDILMNAEWYVSFTISVLLSLMATWGLIGFFPRKRDRGDTGPAWLILAIWLGFLGNGLNVLYWRVFGDMVQHYKPGMWDAYESFGMLWGDIVWKGLALVSIYLHFYARYKSIPPNERKNWTPLTMGFYPNRKHFAVKVLAFWKTKRKP